MAVDCSREWYPLPEVSPTEDRWWEKENAKPFHGKLKTKSMIHKFSVIYGSDVRMTASPSSTPSCRSSLSVSTLTPPTGSDRHQAADLSISSLHTATPLTVDTSSVQTPSYGSRCTASELSSETVQSHTTRSRGVKFVPHLESVTEIDELWQRFLASSLVGKENRAGTRCICGAKNHTPKKREPGTKDSKSEADSTKSSTTPRVKRSVLVERAIQTSPMTHPVERELPHPHTQVPHSASVAFSVASPRPARPQLGQLTLSEAFALSHPEFIEASLRRQRELRERHRDYLEQKAYYATGKDFRKPHSFKPASVRTSKLIYTISHGIHYSDFL